MSWKEAFTVLILTVCVAICNGREINAGTYYCNEDYDLHREKGPVYLVFDAVSNKKTCNFTFTKPDESKEICVDIDEFEVHNPNTSLQYHLEEYSNSPVKAFDYRVYPEGLYCVNRTVHTLIITFRGDDQKKGYDYIRLMVYTNATPSVKSSYFTLAIALCVGAVGLIAVAIFFIRRRRNRRTPQGQQYAYHSTDQNAVTLQTGPPVGPQYQPLPTNQQSAQGNTYFANQGTHPQTGYPSAPGQNMPYGMQQGSIPQTGYSLGPGQNESYGVQTCNPPDTVHNPHYGVPQGVPQYCYSPHEEKQPL